MGVGGREAMIAVGVQVPRELYKRIVEVCICREKKKKKKKSSSLSSLIRK